MAEIEEGERRQKRKEKVREEREKLENPKLMDRESSRLENFKGKSKKIKRIKINFDLFKGGREMEKQRSLVLLVKSNSTESYFYWSFRFLKIFSHNYAYSFNYFKMLIEINQRYV